MMYGELKTRFGEYFPPALAGTHDQRRQAADDSGYLPPSTIDRSLPANDGPQR